jgi:hypothetical protein
LLFSSDIASFAASPSSGAADQRQGQLRHRDDVRGADRAAGADIGRDAGIGAGQLGRAQGGADTGPAAGPAVELDRQRGADHGGGRAAAGRAGGVAGQHREVEDGVAARVDGEVLLRAEAGGDAIGRQPGLDDAVDHGAGLGDAVPGGIGQGQPGGAGGEAGQRRDAEAVAVEGQDGRVGRWHVAHGSGARIVSLREIGPGGPPRRQPNAARCPASDRGDGEACAAPSPEIARAISSSPQGEVSERCTLFSLSLGEREGPVALATGG